MKSMAMFYNFLDDWNGKLLIKKTLMVSIFKEMFIFIFPYKSEIVWSKFFYEIKMLSYDSETDSS